MAIKFLNTVQVDTDVLYVDASINRVGINTATPIYDLDVDGAIRASGGFIDNTFTSDDTVRIVSPDNATYTVASGGETGAIKIQAPLAVLGGATGTSTKVSFKVNTSDGVVIQFSGTFSRPGIGVIDIWTNISATIISDASNDANYTITSTGSGGGSIWIGSSTDSQAGLKSIWVTDCQVSGGNGGLFNGSPLSSAWDVSIDASVPTGFIASTYSNTQVTNWKRNGQGLYYGSGSGNVGIGTTTPSSKLTVNGSTQLGGNVEVSDGLGGDKVLTLGANNGYFSIGDIDGLGDQAFISGDSSSISISTNQITTLHCDSNNRVGIGTTTPSTDLEVSSTGVNGVDISQSASNASQSGRLFFTTNTASEGFALFNSNGTFQVNSGGIPNNTSGTNRISIIGSSGNVGIGTTNPITSLTLGTGSSGISFQSSSTTLNSGKIAVIKQVEVGNGNGNLAFETYQGGGGGGERMRILNDGNVGINTTDPKTKLHVASANGSDVPTAGTATGGLFVSNTNKTYGTNIGVSGSGWSFIQSQRADGLSNLYSLNLQPLGGNVGIGTTSPSELLHLRSTGPARLLIEADTDNITETDNAQIILKQDGGAVVGNLGYKTNTNGLEITNNYAAADGILTLGTSGIERMRIDYLGNVGIGTTSLTAISSSVATLSLGSTSASTSGGIAFQANGVVKAYNYVASNYLYSQTVGGIGQIFYIAGSERMRIHNTTGNVGIGTTSPRSKLQVEGVTGSVPALGAAASAAQIGGSSYGTLFSTLTSGTGVIQQGRSDGVTLTFPLLINPNGGNVGIGVTSPSYQLQLSTNSAAKPSSSAWTVTSDSRVKENVRDYKTGLEAILSIEPKLYDYNGKAGFEKTKDNIGVIAQEIQEVMPETINTYKAKLNEGDEEETELLNFDSHAVTFALINAVKDLKAEIDELKKQINN